MGSSQAAGAVIAQHGVGFSVKLTKFRAEVKSVHRALAERWLRHQRCGEGNVVGQVFHVSGVSIHISPKQRALPSGTCPLGLPRAVSVPDSARGSKNTKMNIMMNSRGGTTSAAAGMRANPLALPACVV